MLPKLRLLRNQASYAFVLTVILSACEGSCDRRHRDMSPEDVVEAYLNIAFNMQDIEQRNDLLLYTTGPLKEAIERASDSTITEAFVDKRYDLKRYSLIEDPERFQIKAEIKGGEATHATRKVAEEDYKFIRESVERD